MSQRGSYSLPPKSGEQLAGETQRLAPAIPAPHRARRMKPGFSPGTVLRVDGAQTIADALAGLPAVEPRTAETGVSSELLEEFAYLYGNQFDSYLVTEPGRQEFWSSGRRGLISYATRGRYVLVGGGLVAPEPEKENLLGEFVEHIAGRGQRVAFHNLGDEELSLFRKFGFQISKWGEEPIVDLGECTWKGKPFEWVRRQTNFCQRHGVTASEVRPEELTAEQWARTLAEVHEVSAESLATKVQANEMRFFEGRIADHELGLRRLFVARSAHGAGRMEGFVICNPMLNGTMWATEMYRHRCDSVRGTTAFLIHHVLKQLQDEGVRSVRMCLDPGLRCGTPLPGDSRLVRYGMQATERWLGLVFDVAGLRHFKSRFRPRYESRYLAALPYVSLGSIMAFVRVLGAFELSLPKTLKIVGQRLRKRATRKTLSDVE